eukprot:765440-Hanusia_phi.AAC.1
MEEEGEGGREGDHAARSRNWERGLGGDKGAWVEDEQDEAGGGMGDAMYRRENNGDFAESQQRLLRQHQEPDDNETE